MNHLPHRVGQNGGWDADDRRLFKGGALVVDASEGAVPSGEDCLPFLVGVGDGLSLPGRPGEAASIDVGPVRVGGEAGSVTVLNTITITSVPRVNSLMSSVRRLTCTCEVGSVGEADVEGRQPAG